MLKLIDNAIMDFMKRSSIKVIDNELNQNDFLKQILAAVMIKLIQFIQRHLISDFLHYWIAEKCLNSQLIFR